MIYWDSGLLYQITRYELILDVHDDCIETVGWWISYYCILVQMYMWYWPALDETVYWTVSGIVIVIIYVIEVTGKILSDCNTFIVILFYSLHGILFTLLLLHWYCYCHCIVPVIEMTWILIVRNDNNVNWQLILGLRKLMEETASVF